jgi:hypothetical protein
MIIRCQMQRSSPGDEGLFITLKSAGKNKKYHQPDALDP